MSFFALLILLSLIVIVPLIFVMKEKSKHLQADSTHRHQEYLATVKSTAPEKILNSDINKSTADRDNSATPHPSTAQRLIIDFNAQHPFIQLLYDEQLPLAFRETMDAIGQQYERTHHQHLTKSQLFTLNKLIESRIPELLRDYLSLDPNYATTVIIDKHKTSTSYTMVLEQLQSILDFTQKINNQSQSGVVDKLLASRRYLDEVAQDSGMADDIFTIK
ncbi:hypothetical protein [Psychrobacter sp. 16-MNA-CIBAN-0192]|uniref:hypothetical protein n=1 Tax=Psychrobacter sp. 16-MNA-CIBAN-0192 TaxID=3140448 RepID=UPI0033172B6B